MRSREEIIYPLTHIQKGLLFETLYNRESESFYIVQMAFEIKQKINISLFIKAFHIVMGRHAVLRSATHFNRENIGLSKLVIQSEVEIPTVFYDYSAADQKNQLKDFKSFLDQDLQSPIDLTQAPLMRLTFFKFHENHYAIVWTRHHILMGGASVELVIRELFIIYFSLLHGTSWALDQPHDYRKLSYDEQFPDAVKSKIFWKKAFAEYTNIGFIPNPPQENKNLIGVRQIANYLEGEDYQRLNSLVSNNQLTINSVLQAALSLVLSAYTGKENIIFGTVRSYPRDQVKNCVGLFINTLPIRMHVDPKEIVTEYLHKIREQNIFLRTYAYTSLSKIREWAELPVDFPLYQCILDYKPRSLNVILKREFPDLNGSVSLQLDTPYPLVFEIIDEGEFLQINLHYQASLFSNDYSVTILQYFKELLQQIVIHPEITLAQLPSVTRAEYGWLLRRNETDVNYPVDKTIHQLFEEQVRKTPSALALTYEAEKLSYQRLNERANQLAHYLIQHHAAKEMRVAICLRAIY
jgi:hypothetical protein